MRLRVVPLACQNEGCLVHERVCLKGSALKKVPWHVLSIHRFLPDNSVLGGALFPSALSSSSDMRHGIKCVHFISSLVSMSKSESSSCSRGENTDTVPHLEAIKRWPLVEQNCIPSPDSLINQSNFIKS